MDANQHEEWMRRCLLLARHGSGHVAPNPMVGAVLIHNGHVLAEGWHKVAGGPHAEVECLRQLADVPVPEEAVLYVNLEPCSHQGRTPPCADLLIERGIRHVVIGQRDPFPLVAGRGVARLRNAGITVTEDVLSDDCRWQQRRFLTSIEKRRPLVILKWARSADGFLDQHPRSGRSVQRISCAATDVLVHGWRAEEGAILVGSRTVLHDDPALTVRHVAGRQPLRVVLDRNGITPAESRIYQDGGETLLVTDHARPELQVEQVLIDRTEDPIGRMLNVLHERGVRSVLIEGGAELLGHFIRCGLYDEARVITGEVLFRSGTPAPLLGSEPVHRGFSGTDTISLHVHTPNPVARWDR